MVKRIMCTIMFITLLGTMLPAFAIDSGDPMWVVNCSEYVSLRKNTSSTSVRLKKVNLYEQVTYMGGASNGFTQVGYNGAVGYILSKYLTVSKPEKLGNWDWMPSIGESMYVVLCKDFVSLWSEARTSSSRLAKVPLYGRVEYLASVDDRFTKVKYNGKTGYVLSEYLDLYEPNIATDSNWDWTPSDGDAMWIINCNYYVSLRAAPSTSSTQLARIPLGAKVRYRGEKPYALNDFVMVEYDGQTGYVKSEYLNQYEPQG